MINPNAPKNFLYRTIKVGRRWKNFELTASTSQQSVNHLNVSERKLKLIEMAKRPNAYTDPDLIM